MTEKKSERSKLGVFDSGVGGLSVWRELLKELPYSDFIYFSDNAFCPYGSRTQDEITRRVSKAVDFLLKKDVSIIVIACNTATAAAIETLRKNYRIPFIGMEPAVKPAAIHSVSGVIGVLATQATLKGKLYNNTLEHFASDVKVIQKVGAGLVEAVEHDQTDSPHTLELLKTYIMPMVEAGADHIVLGCTHYPFLAEQIRVLTGGTVAIVDPAPAVARHTRNIMTERGLLHDQIFNTEGKTLFFSTGETAILQKIAESIKPGIKPEDFKRVTI